MPTTKSLLGSIRRAITAPRTDPIHEAVLKARSYGIAWSAIARTISEATGESHTVAAVWSRYSHAAEARRDYARDRARKRRRPVTILPGLSVPEAARQVGISATVAYRRIKALPTGDDRITTAYRGSVPVTRVLNVEALHHTHSKRLD